MTALVIAEHDHQNLQAATLHTISSALLVDPDVDVVVIGHNCLAICEQVAKVAGVKQVLQVDSPAYADQLAENCSKLIQSIASDYSAILTSASTFGKNLLPRISALLDVDQISDIVEILSPNEFTRPIYAGNALAYIQHERGIKVLSVRATSFPKAESGEATAPIKTVSNEINNEQAKFIEFKQSCQERPSLVSAKKVVSGGRGLQSKENFKLIESLADTLGAAIGASRAAVDAGFVPNDYQVGQTGKIVAPELYIAIGISGAVQHLAGMKESKVIVAINKDPEAPIFKVADYGLVGDLFEIVPELQQKITNL